MMRTRLKAEGKRRALAALLLAALLLPQASGAGRAQTGEDALLTATEEFHQTYPLAAGGRVSLSNINGRVKITGWDRDEVKKALNEEQYSLWPKYKAIPQGWSAVGKEGTKAECCSYVDEVWTDMRPLSLRKRMAESRANASD